MRSLPTVAIMALYLTVSSHAAVALDFTPDPSRVLSDPTFLPVKGQVYGATDYTYSNSESKTYRQATGLYLNKSKSTAHRIGQEFSYGLTNNVALRANISYIPDRENKQTSAAGVVTTRNSDGFSNPNLGVTWRAIEQGQSSPVTLDIMADYAPDLIDNKRASATKDGTVGTGKDVAGLSTQLSYKTRSFTIAGSLGVEYNGKRQVEVQNSPTRINTDSYWGGFVGLDTQTRLGGGFSFDLGVSYSMDQDTDSTNSTTRITSNRDGGDNASVSVGLNYNITPAVVAGVSYGYSHITDIDTTFVLPATNTVSKSNGAHRLGASLKYVF